MPYKDLELLEVRPGKLDFISASFKNPVSQSCFRFLKRVFGVPEVNKVTIDSQESLSSVFYDQKRTNWKDIIRAIFKRAKKSVSISSSIFTYPEIKKGKIVFSRHSKFITSWEVLRDLPGRLRIKNPVLLYRKGCCEEIRKTLEEVPGVQTVKTSPLTGSVLILYDDRKISKSELIKIADDALKLVPEENKKIEKPSWKGLPLSTLTASLAMIPGLGPYTLPLILYTGWPIYKRASQALKNKEIKVDILDAAVVSACLGFRNFGSAALMVWVLDVADTIQEKTSQQSKGLLEKVFSQQAKFTRVLKGKEELEISINKVNLGDTVVVSTGESIPIDGEVLEGEGMVDQSMLTGEAVPVEKKVGDKVLASTLLLTGKLYIKVEKTAKESTSAKVLEIIQKSAEYKPKVLSFGEKMADKAVIPTLGLSGVGMMTGGPQSMLAILNADFGTGIRVAAPTSVLAHMTMAARSGIIIKKGQVLETLPEVDTFLFDKTGTLTREVPQVDNIIPALRGFPEEKVLAYAAASEERFSHPIAKSILGKTAELKLKIPKREESNYHIGFGVHSMIEGNAVRVGSIRFIEREGILIPSSIRRKLGGIHNNGSSAILVAVNDNLAGAIEFRAEHRAEAYDTIQKLKQRGIKNLVLISGDHEAATRETAEKLGIDYYFPEVLPQDKANFVKELQKRGGKVAMVGDGINDGAALSLADVSISLKGGSDIAIDAADVVFMDGDLTKLDQLYEISDSLRKSLNRSLKTILVPNIICITGALFRMVGLGMSMVLNNGFNMVATIQATNPLYRRLGPVLATQAQSQLLLSKNERKNLRNNFK